MGPVAKSVITGVAGSIASFAISVAFGQVALGGYVADQWAADPARFVAFSLFVFAFGFMSGIIAFAIGKKVPKLEADRDRYLENWKEAQVEARVLEGKLQEGAAEKPDTSYRELWNNTGGPHGR